MVLKEVAYLLRKQLRAFDLAYRLGGEEFLILVPGSDIEHTAELAERLRERSPPTRGGGIGGDDEPRRRRLRPQGERFDYNAVFAEADAALYRAKRSGRNRVCIAERDEQAGPARARRARRCTAARRRSPDA